MTSPLEDLFAMQLDAAGLGGYVREFQAIPGRKGIGIDLSFKYLQENAKVRVESAELPLLNFIEQ